MKIEIFGTGCAKCINTKNLVKEVLDAHGKSIEILEVNRTEDIIERGVYLTPAVAIDGDVKISGRVPTREEIEQILGL
ncbi:MAG: thioredoxin family protein [Candidatus Thorarchaeota archaeon]|nr:MAG: thioredoxin family protein [Candidatus Thorarchaeota archaeon]RLI54604.1 MAG: thioredoxin family protein [Candidatus Thorarchaeota archaeon]